ncbi:hypothetical protein ACFWY9_29770 [Amycolatopsis sp. NPDC059027]|uniref:hypothetical protein n=1 Tax=Amycolatopsis sp. NPDC059027 TaxID=3346709 RepID=UPI00366CEB0C
MSRRAPTRRLTVRRARVVLLATAPLFLVLELPARWFALDGWRTPVLAVATVTVLPAALIAFVGVWTTNGAGR